MRSTKSKQRISPHADEHRLRVLVFGDEGSSDFQVVAAHVENCPDCRDRLEQLAGAGDALREVSSLLSSYSPDGGGTRILESSDPEVLDFLAPARHPEMLGRLGRYEIERVVGSGGMGVVLKGFDTELNRPVAIKVLARHLAHSGAARQRFARESQAAAAIVHEHVVAIHNVETEGRVPFIVMPFVDGESLQARVDRDGPLNAKELLRIGIHAAAGLSAAHEQGVVHRDVKPANILLENGVERTLLTDFGLARTVDDASLTHTGILAGTPHYMSPEQANGDPTDHRSDLFSLGSVLYFMATGRPPFRAERAMGVLKRICHDRHRPVWQVNGELPDQLGLIIDRLLQKKPKHRFPNADAVKHGLAEVLATIQQRSPKPNRLRRLSGGYQRLAIGTAGSVLVLAGLVLAAITNPWGHSREDAQPVGEGATARHGSSTAARADARSGMPWAEVAMYASAGDADAFAQQLKTLHRRLQRLDTAVEAGPRLRVPAAGWDEEVQSIHGLLDQLGRNP